MLDLRLRRVARFNGLTMRDYLACPEEERIEMEAFYEIDTATPKQRTAMAEAAQAERQQEIEAALRSRLREGSHG